MGACPCTSNPLNKAILPLARLSNKCLCSFKQARAHVPVSVSMNVIREFAIARARSLSSSTITRLINESARRALQSRPRLVIAVT